MATDQENGKPGKLKSQGSRSTLDGLDNLEMKRRRFEEAGKFPVRKFVIYLSILVVVALLGTVGWSKLKAS